MDAEEVDFVAESSMITILPNFSENRIYMISGDYGPFNPSLPVDVPLWLGVHLKNRQKCRFQPPDWLAVGEVDCFASDTADMREPVLSVCVSRASV
jgi:GINS complex subunit 2